MPPDVRDENNEPKMELNACTEAVTLRVMDRLNSIEETVNKKLASFEAQIQELGHSMPTSTSGVHEHFKVNV